ncbi:MAG: glycine--tRNA ligase subunit beta [Rhodospirillales bacterium]
MPELLIEVLTEEVPAWMQPNAADVLAVTLMENLGAAGLETDSENIETFVTPRRLCAVVRNLPAETESAAEDRKGPKADAPEAAVAGFKSKLPEGAVVETRATPKGDVLFAKIERPGRPAAEVLAEFIPEVLDAISWPKSMRWAEGVRPWVRPVRGFLALFGGAVLDIEFRGVRAGGETTGHRFLAPEPFAVTDFADYKAKLHAAKVMLDSADRQETILEGARALAAAEGLTLNTDYGLLEELVGLAEWPVPRMGRIDEAFMDLPPEALAAAMRAHQKYMTCTDKDGNLAPRFVYAAGTETEDGEKEITAGNERVLRARLADARFFWDKDRAAPLESRLDALKDLVFHAKLGSVYDKALRLQGLAGRLAESIDGCVPAHAERAALLAKPDLSTGMVGEFPELQGVMGGYYAGHDGENEDICAAVAQHYRPMGPKDAAPSAPAAVALALADKLDTLAGFWAAGEKPTGSKDPFALRRAVLGVIRIILENNLHLPLRAALKAAHEGYEGVEAAQAFDAGDLLDFFAKRLTVHLRSEGVSYDRTAAAFAAAAAAGEADNLARIAARARALKDFLDTPEGADLLAAYRRTVNIVEAETGKGESASDDFDESLLREDAEKALHKAFTAVKLREPLEKQDFAEAMRRLAELRPAVDKFFDDVTVNADDAALRKNRLALLARVRSEMNLAADLSKIQG